MSLKTLNPKNKLFQILRKNPPKWWISLVNDDDIYIDIRKDNYIDVYHNGGNVIRELRYKSNSFQGKIHYKYIPLISDEDYIDYTFSSSSIHFTPLNILPLNNFDNKAIHLIKKQIKKYYPNKSEKGFQASFIKKNNNFIDTEFAYNGLRIDLVRIDNKSKKIVFIELKTKDDTRLIKKPYQAKSEIAIQLDKYHNFIKTNKKDLKDYYKKVFEIKKNVEYFTCKFEKVKFN